MLDCSRRDSDGDLSLATTNSSSSSSHSSMSGGDVSCSSFNRISFELPTSLSSPLNLTLKPHRSSDFAYSVIRSATFGRKSGLSFRDFRLLRRIGCGDIGTVYLCRLSDELHGCNIGKIDTRCCYAMKVVDKEVVAMKKKVQRVEMEKKILKMLDHPFLPSLYADFEASHFSCIVMEYCSGGDLHSMRHKQPRKRFSLSSARFYTAEVLVALEYLHMLGIIYRDLKPENVLVRSDGHIMLSDFDLSLTSDAIPAVESPPSVLSSSYGKGCQSRFSRFRNRFFGSKKVQNVSRLLFVAEPVAARSCSFVGTHEYVSPEVASGGSHGNAVDWWSLGIFMYELIYGYTPFAATSNENTLRNIVKKDLVFPTQAPASMFEFHARDLLSGLLNKDPNNRLGSKRGSADIKTHPFFKGLNFALVRTITPPQIPGLSKEETTSLVRGNSKSQPTTTAFDYF